MGNIFRGLDPDPEIVTRYDENRKTAFQPAEESGEEYGEIVFGPDIYPGQSVIDANAILGVTAAAAHELTHYHRCRDKQALDELELEYLDEALTSLQAIQRYGAKLSDTDLRQLVADAIARIHLFVEERAVALPSDAKEADPPAGD